MQYLQSLCLGLFLLIAGSCQGQDVNALPIFEDWTGKAISFEEISQLAPDSVVLVDVWATWCGPCKKEMPHSKALAESLEGQPVAFIFLGVQSKRRVWKKLIESMELDYGQHFLGKEGDIVAWLKALDIKYIPRYMLRDKHGKWATLDAPAPSQADCLTQIQALLKS